MNEDAAAAAMSLHALLDTLRELVMTAGQQRVRCTSLSCLTGRET